MCLVVLLLFVGVLFGSLLGVCVVVRLWKFYLVGFDVFCVDVVVYGEVFKVLCVCYGFEGFYLLDNVLLK